MWLTKPRFVIEQIMGIDSDPLFLIEAAGRTCYKSEGKSRPGSAANFVKSLRDRGHESVIEHSAMTVRFIIDRGVSHELVRHRLCAFSQESTRYCNYGGGVTFILPPWVNIPPGEYLKRISIRSSLADDIWFQHMFNTGQEYTALLQAGWSPQEARSILPNSLKTEIVVTANFREWRHIFKLRCSTAAHPQMREVMIPLLGTVRNQIPVVFDDIPY
jgi:thymidylate synthase (FAD)